MTSLSPKEKADCSKNEDDEKLIDVEERIAALLIEKQRCEYEKKLENLKSVKENKGKSAAVFCLKAKILGGKKAEQEAVVIENPVDKEILFDAERIKEASLSYLKNLLKNREPKDDYKRDILTLKILHEVRMAEEVKDDENLTPDDFSNLLKQLNKNNKNKYNCILKE